MGIVVDLFSRHLSLMFVSKKSEMIRGSIILLQFHLFLVFFCSGLAPWLVLRLGVLCWDTYDWYKGLKVPPLGRQNLGFFLGGPPLAPLFMRLEAPPPPMPQKSYVGPPFHFVLAPPLAPSKIYEYFLFVNLILLQYYICEKSFSSIQCLN